jgi:replicative DNA helicase
MMITIHLQELSKKLFPVKETIDFATGFPKLDETTRGLHRGDLYLICGHKGVGKTAFMAQVINSILGMERSVHAVSVFSIDLSAEQLTERFISNLSKVSIENIKLRKLSPYEKEVLVPEANVKLARYSLYIDDSAIIDIHMLQERIYLLHGRGNADVVFIDNLQLIDNPYVTYSVDQLYSFAQALKNIALNLNIPIVLLSSINENEEGELKRPTLYDITEQRINVKHPDVVLCLYRPEHYKYEFGETELIIMKNAWGPLTTINLIADLSTQSFKEQSL